MGKVVKIPKSGEKEFLKIKNQIKKVMGVDLTYGQVMKILIWKSRNSKAEINERQLLEILNGH